MRAAVAALALGACSAGQVASCPDAAVCGGACPVTWAGNFAETTSSPANCASLSSGMLDFTVASPRLGSALTIALDLGAAPTIGPYSSETSSSWTAVAARSIGDGGCVYSAGSQVVPAGSFTLAMTSIDPPHGTLDVVLYVHALEATDCGAADTETLDAVF